MYNLAQSPLVQSPMNTMVGDDDRAREGLSTRWWSQTAIKTLSALKLQAAPQFATVVPLGK
jgi:hypothetical protein